MDSHETDDTIDNRCVYCYQGSNQRCSACRQVPYCSKECQKKDWSSHKWFCKLQYPEKEPNKNSVRAVLLPVDSERPTFVNVDRKLDCSLTLTPAGSAAVARVRGSGEPDRLDAWYSGYEQSVFLGDDAGNGRRMRWFPMHAGVKYNRMITVFFRDNFWYDGSEPNRCIATITKGENTSRWKGPVLIYQSNRVSDVVGNPEPKYVDFEKMHGNEIVTFFLEPWNIMEKNFWELDGPR